MKNVFILLVVSLYCLNGYCQSIADLTRKAEEKKNPLLSFNFIGDFHNGLAVAKKQAEDGTNVYAGVIDEEANIYVPFAYDALSMEKEGSNYLDNIYRCKKNGKYGLVNSEGYEILPCKYPQLINMQGTSLYWVAKGGKCGYVELNGSKEAVTEVIPCIYDRLAPPTRGLIYATYQGLKGILNETNKIVVPFNFSEISISHNNMVWVEKDGKHGVYDLQGNERQACDIEDAFVYLDKQRCAVSYEKGPIFPDDNIYIIRNGMVGIMNGDSHTIIPCEYQHITPFITHKAFCKKDGKWGIIRENGEVVQPCVFSEILSDGGIVSVVNLPSTIFTTFLYVKKDMKWGMLNATGTDFIEAKYDSIGVFNDGMLLVKKDYKYIYINEEGQEAILCKYHQANDFSDGLAAAMTDDGKYLFIDKQGNIVIKPNKYDKVGAFIDGKCEVSKNGKTWEIDKQGKKVKKEKDVK